MYLVLSMISTTSQHFLPASSERAGHTSSQPTKESKHILTLANLSAEHALRKPSLPTHITYEVQLGDFHSLSIDSVVDCPRSRPCGICHDAMPPGSQQSVTDFVRLLDNPPDIVQRREELFHLRDGTIRLTPEDFDRYWPYMTNAYVPFQVCLASREKDSSL